MWHRILWHKTLEYEPQGLKSWNCFKPDPQAGSDSRYLILQTINCRKSHMLSDYWQLTHGNTSCNLITENLLVPQIMSHHINGNGNLAGNVSHVILASLAIIVSCSVITNSFLQEMSHVVWLITRKTQETPNRRYSSSPEMILEALYLFQIEEVGLQYHRDIEMHISIYLYLCLYLGSCWHVLVNCLSDIKEW